MCINGIIIVDRSNKNQIYDYKKYELTNSY